MKGMYNIVVQTQILAWKRHTATRLQFLMLRRESGEVPYINVQSGELLIMAPKR